MALSDRIKAIVEHSGLSIPQFAKYVGFKTPQTVREIISGKTKTLSYAVKNKINSKYPEINPIWLESGEGDMLNSVSQEHYQVGIGIGKQQGGKNEFKVEIEESDNTKSIEEEERKICALEIEIEHLQERLKEKDATIATLQASVKRLEKMNDFLMGQK